MAKAFKLTPKGRTIRFEEDAEQIALFEWARMSAARCPELATLFSIPNGAALAGSPKRRAQQMARLKAAGLVPGVSDVCLPVKRGPYGSLWIEMKAPGKEKRLTDTQKEWGELMEKHGNKFVVCDTSIKAIVAIKDYLNLTT